jgi:HAD superfamily hydrolase (TIGR01549 family)
VIKNLKNLKKVYKLAIVTSKDALRTKYFIKKLKINFDYVSCPAEGLRGKPYPDQINLVLKKLKISNTCTLYVGDTIIEKKETITRCADHPHEFGTGPYMCGVNKQALTTATKFYFL